jgi:hypothetical protein
MLFRPCFYKDGLTMSDKNTAAKTPAEEFQVLCTKLKEFGVEVAENSSTDGFSIPMDKFHVEAKNGQLSFKPKDPNAIPPAADPASPEDKLPPVAPKPAGLEAENPSLKAFVEEQKTKAAEQKKSEMQDVAFIKQKFEEYESQIKELTAKLNKPAPKSSEAKPKENFTADPEEKPKANKKHVQGMGAIALIAKIKKDGGL